MTRSTRGDTVFELEHTAAVEPAMWAEFGPGAVGVGWDLTLLGLGLHLGGGGDKPADPQVWQKSAEARDFMTRSGTAWGAAHAASGAPADEAVAAAQRTRTAYVCPSCPDPSRGTDRPTNQADARTLPRHVLGHEPPPSGASR